MASMSDQQQLLINHKEEEEDEELFMQALHLAKSSALPMVLKAAIELDLLEIIAKCKNNQPLSASEIASQISTQNPDAPFFVERILRFLASNSILKCTLVAEDDGNSRSLYSLAPVCKYLTKNNDGVSIAPYLVFVQSKIPMECWYYLKDAVIEGDTPFHKAHGFHAFDLTDRTDYAFNEAMHNNTSLIMKKVLEKYNGFERLKEVVDVGGGIGASLGMIVSMYPHIKGINFDLPRVIKEAPIIPGVHHVGGDMFTNVPEGEAIFVKWILHNWDDEKCLKLLKNCRNALPNGGKVIVMEQIVTEFPETDIISKNVVEFDMLMLMGLPGAKERTKKEFENLATSAGFETVKFVCRVFGLWLIELFKSSN